MKITLSFEKTISSDLSIMVDVLRASTTITAALDTFDEIIPCFSKKEAFEIKKSKPGVLAGERNGKKIEGFDVGNSPQAIKNYKFNENEFKRLILTTTNGTRALKNMKSKVLIGSLINAKSVAKRAIELSNNHIDVVMAGRKGKFAIEDFIASGEILFWILQILTKEHKITEKAQSAVLARYDYDNIKKAFYNSYSGSKLIEIGYKEDVDYCLKKNITENVAIYHEGILKSL